MERLLIAGISFSIYTSIGFIMQKLVHPPSHLDRKTAVDYIGQHVSLVHAVLAIIFAITVYFIEGGIHYEADTNIYHLLVLGVRFIQHSLGYFYYDMIYAEIYGLHDTAMRFHHISTLAGGTALYLSSAGGSTAIRLILKARNEDNTWLYKKVEEAFAVVFIFNRLIVGTFVNYNMWAAKISIGIKLAVSAIYYIGLYWVFAIGGMIAKKMREKYDKPKGITALFLRVLGWIRRNTGIFLVLTFTWSFAFPYIATQVMEASYKNIRVANFIIV